MLTDGRRRHRYTMGSPAEKVERNVGLSLISVTKSHLSVWPISIFCDKKILMCEFLISTRHICEEPVRLFLGREKLVPAPHMCA